jgi:hypothetical protein
MNATHLPFEIQQLIYRLCQTANLSLSSKNLKGYQLSKMQMAYRIYCEEQELKNRKKGKAISDIMWKDVDGVIAFATLYADLMGNLFELDVWKLNFTKPKCFPEG